MQENEIPRDRLAGLRRIPLSWVFFPLALLYHELLLRAFDPASVFFDGALLPIALAAIGGGLLLSLLCGLLPWRKTVRWVSLCLTLLWSVFVCVQYCCKSYFKTYFALTFMVTMTGHVVGDFAATILEIILTRLPFILLAMLPLVLAIVLRRRIVPEARTGRTVLRVMAGLSVLTIGGSAVLFRLGPNAALYTYDFNTDSAVSKFGLGSSLGLELTYALTGTPAPPLPSLPQPEEPVEDVTPEPVVYGYNTLDIDFAALADSASNSTLSSIHRYVASRTPSRQNEYTGMFKGKNLILLTAEAFSPWFISEELTPYAVPPDPRGLRLHQLLPARLGAVHHRRRICRPHRPAAHMDRQQRQLLGQPQRLYAAGAGQPVPRAGLSDPRVARQHLQLL